MNITLEAVEKVMDAANVDYRTAKEALEHTDGDADEAIRLLNPEPESQVTRVVDKLKDMVAEGNVSRIRIVRKGETILNVPVNVGLAGGLLGLVAAPWAMIAGAVAAYGLECRIVVEKNDGTNDEL